MKRIALLGLTITLLAPSAPAHGQLGFAAGVSGGTLGITGDFAVSVTDRIALRTGATVSRLEANLDGQFGFSSQHTGTLSVPDGTFKLGADFQFGGARLGAGLIIWSESPFYQVALGSGDVELGDNSYSHTQVSAVTASLEATERAPYVLLGFGSAARDGLGMFLDIGAVLLTDTKVSVTATGDAALIGTAGFQRALQDAGQEVEEELGSLINYWPMVSLGLRYGF